MSEICEHGTPNWLEDCEECKKQDENNSASSLGLDRSGYDRLWAWFSLSYSSWLTIPRVLMHEMPDEWQGKMTELLEEYQDAFPNQPDLGTRVQVTEGNKLTKTPHWLINYRRPDCAEIDKLRAV